jgi:U4/U6.U5 tri-snRNP-associated protein 1
MSSEEVLVLSVDETNKLRAKLGLAPLRLESAVIPAAHNSNDHPPAARSSSDAEQQQEELLEMNVADSNDLREKLGLSVLRESSSETTIVHAPAHNEGERKEAAERIERAKLQRQVEQGISRFKNQKSLGEESSSAKSWAAQMRSQQEKNNAASISQKNHVPGVASKKKTSTAEQGDNYDETDLHGMNVGHAMSELQDGSTTILTLADESLLKTRDDTSKKVIGLNEDDVALENVNLAEQRTQQQGLRDKRKIELGMGRAGGYAGFDDDEFEDLGGSQAPSRLARGGPADAAATKKQSRGFQIGSHLQDDGDDEPDLFAGQKGKAISLDPSQADVAASDFMTAEEDEALRQQKKKKKDSKFKKKDKKKKDKKKKKRAAESDDEDDDTGETKPQRGLLEELEETAVDATTAKKRRRANDELTATDPSNAAAVPMEVVEDKQEEANKRAKFDAIMAKGNERTREAFQTKAKPVDLDEEPDDAFLNAALAKARRLNRLREMSKAKKTPRGADAVVEAVQSSRAKQDEQTPSGTIAFAVDETREFTRALLARAEQTEREQARKAIKKEDKGADETDTNIDENPVPLTVKEEPVEEMDITELAKEVEEEEDVPDAEGFAGTYGSVAPMGRGLAGVLGMLKQTGEITRKNAGKEEMRGRAKDKRTYEDYESLDLSKVVKIDQRTATDKDKDFASREIKLEYRDKHGRLLTRKEAFRDLSYQFHVHGIGKIK